MDGASMDEYQEIMPISSTTGNGEETIWSVNGEVSPETLVAILAWGFIIFLVFYAVNAIFLGKIFKKAGVPAWQAWVPVLNSWKTLEIGGRQGYWAILAFIPLVNIISAIFMIIAIYNINLKLKYGAGMTALAVILPFIWVIIAGSSKNEWNDSLGAKSLVDDVRPPATSLDEDPKPPTSL